MCPPIYTYNLLLYAAVNQIGEKSVNQQKIQFNNNTWRLQYPYSIMNRTTRQQIKKEREDFSNTIHKLELTFIYRTFHATVAEHKSFSSAHGRFSSLDHRLGHKTINVKGFKS